MYQSSQQMSFMQRPSEVTVTDSLCVPANAIPWVIEIKMPMTPMTMTQSQLPPNPIACDR